MGGNNRFRRISTAIVVANKLNALTESALDDKSNQDSALTENEQQNEPSTTPVTTPVTDQKPPDIGVSIVLERPINQNALFIRSRDWLSTNQGPTGTKPSTTPVTDQKSHGIGVSSLE